MRYAIEFAPQAIEDLKEVDAYIRASIRDAIESHLRYEPTKESKSRIKRLRGLARPQYRLLVEEFRIFYDVAERRVQVLAIVPKSGVEAWLAKWGEKS